MDVLHTSISRIFIGLCIILFVTLMFGLDSLFFMKSTQGVILKVESKMKSARVPESQLEIAFLAPDINYEYDVEHVKYFSNTIYLKNMVIANGENTQKILKKVLIGSSVKVFYDARYPSNSWLYWHPFSIASIIFSLLVSGGYIFSGLSIIWKKWRLKYEDISPLNRRKNYAGTTTRKDDSKLIGKPIFDDRCFEETKLEFPRIIQPWWKHAAQRIFVTVLFSFIWFYLLEKNDFLNIFNGLLFLLFISFTLFFLISEIITIDVDKDVIIICRNIFGLNLSKKELKVSDVARFTALKTKYGKKIIAVDINRRGWSICETYGKSSQPVSLVDLSDVGGYLLKNYPSKCKFN